MALLIVRMKALPEKRMELSQTISSLSVSTSMQTGCLRCDTCQDIDEENRLFILQKWNTRKNIATFLQSEYFMVLRRAMKLLSEPYEITCHTVFHPSEIEEYLGARITQS